MTVNLSDLKKVTDEIIGEDDLINFLDSGINLRHYIGFEISGLVHLGQGIATGLVIRELQKLGVKTSIYLADWHTWINDKLNGDKELIRKVAFEYFAPAIRLSIQIAGGKPDEVDFVFGSELYYNNDRYWQTVVEVGKNLTVSRVKKSTAIMGREESDEMKFAMLLYPPMQVADIFEMGCHIAHAGTDQRKCHVIAREVAQSLRINPLRDKDGKIVKPIAIHHSLVSGLQAPAEWPIPSDIDRYEFLSKYKMSKSIPNSAVFIQDTEVEIREKIRKAFCPEQEIRYNPILNWIKNIIFPITGSFVLKREEKFGGTKSYSNYTDLERDFETGDIFPLDLKNNVAELLIDILLPARTYFDIAERQEVIQIIKDIKKTR